MLHAPSDYFSAYGPSATHTAAWDRWGHEEWSPPWQGPNAFQHAQGLTPHSFPLDDITAAKRHRADTQADTYAWQRPPWAGSLLTSTTPAGSFPCPPEIQQVLLAPHRQLLLALQQQQQQRLQQQEQIPDLRGAGAGLPLPAPPPREPRGWPPTAPRMQHRSDSGSAGPPPWRADFRGDGACDAHGPLGQQNDNVDGGQHGGENRCPVPAEPEDVLVVNSIHSGAFSLLRRDAACAELVAFDAEWQPDFAWGSDHPVSVLQLAFPSSRRVYVVQINRLGGKLPSAVQLMLVDPRVIKVGFDVDRADITKLQRTGIAVTRDSVIDVQERCVSTGAVSSTESGLKACARRVLGYTLDKTLACSDWSNDRLTPEQVRYAALDAWVTLRLYYSVA